MKIERWWVLVCVAGILAGCGQKGPLVLPDAPKHKKAAPTLHPSPAPAPVPASASTPEPAAATVPAPAAATPSPPDEPTKP